MAGFARQPQISNHDAASLAVKNSSTSEPRCSIARCVGRLKNSATPTVDEKAYEADPIVDKGVLVREHDLSAVFALGLSDHGLLLGRRHGLQFPS